MRTKLKPQREQSKCILECILISEANRAEESYFIVSGSPNLKQKDKLTLNRLHNMSSKSTSRDVNGRAFFLTL